MQEADHNNATRSFDKDCAHLPDTWAGALKYHQMQIAEHHAAMPANDFDFAFAIRNYAHLLARKLNGGETGILANDDAPGCRLDKAAQAEAG